MDNQQLFSEFKESLKHKYEFKDSTPLGTGQDVVAYKGVDIDRQVDVAIKFYLKGAPPAGSERDWKFTSGTIHPQIAPTFTIESFKASDGESYKVVVARFIPGIVLGKLLQGLNDCEEELQKQVAWNMADSLIPSLLDAVEVIHNLRFGHGDLSDSNIMTFLTDDYPNYGFGIVLLDFDNNAPSKWDGKQYSEKDMIEGGIRSLKSIISDTIRFLPWADSMDEVIKAYSHIKQIKKVYNFVLRYVKLTQRQEDTAFNLNELLKEIYMELGPYYFDPIIKAIQEIAITTGREGYFNLGYDQFEKNKADYDFQRRTRVMTVYPDIGPISAFYSKIFG